MLGWGLDFLGELLGLAGEAASAAIGWAWETVVEGIYTWLASGLAALIEWVWGVLDSGTTPRVTGDWYRNELAGRLGVIALAVTIAMMLASAAQAALAGRPEQIGDAVGTGTRAVVASALTVTVVDLMIRLVDEFAEMVWQVGRDDLVQMLEGMTVLMTAGGPAASTFIGPLALLLGFAGLLGLVVALSMRSALIYLVAALAPLVWSSSVLPVMRGSDRRMVHLLVALIVSKLAIVVSLVVAVKLIANPAGDPTSDSVANDAAAAVGTLLAGFTCFVIAAISPWVLYKLMPTVEAAVVSSGIAGGLGRSMMSTAHAGLMVKGMSPSLATRHAPGQEGLVGLAAGSGAAGGWGGAAARGGTTSRAKAPAGSGNEPGQPGAPDGGQRESESDSGPPGGPSRGAGGSGEGANRASGAAEGAAGASTNAPTSERPGPASTPSSVSGADAPADRRGPGGASPPPRPPRRQGPGGPADDDPERAP